MTNDIDDLTHTSAPLHASTDVSRTDPSRLAAPFAGIALVAGALILDPAVAGSDAAGATDIAPDFSTLDADADGTLSEKEWMESAPASMMSEDMAASHFSMYDADGDDSVSPEEYEQVNREALKETESDPI